MGSVSCHRPKGITNKAFFQDLYGSGYTVLEASQQRGKPIYMAVRHERGDMAGVVFGVVVLTHYNRGYHNFWYKDMSEDMGPVESEAPRKILDLLSPTDHEYALEWRARCEANLARKAAQPKVSKGTRIRLTNPLAFTNGGEYQNFKYVKGSTFEVEGVTNGYGYPLQVRIRNWRSREFEVLPATPEAERLEASYSV